MNETKRTKAQEATQAIERIYIAMRHLFNRGFYKPMGISGTTLREGLLALQPEIYGSIGEDKVELSGLLYVLDRLPHGIEECPIINLTGDEGYQLSNIQPIVPPKRRRNCYRIDKDQMNVEITRGRSDIYDILTHLTFLFIESHKIANRAVINDTGSLTSEWLKFEKVILQEEISNDELEVAMFHCANILGRTFQEVLAIHKALATKEKPNRLLKVIYWLGKLAIEEVLEINKRIILFSPVLRERTGHHMHGERWANRIKKELEDQDIIDRPIHIISANMHSVMNYLFSKQTITNQKEKLNKIEVFERLSQPQNREDRNQISELAAQQGMTYLKDVSGTNIDVQIFDLSKMDLSKSYLSDLAESSNDVIIVMDYAFGEQAFETMDELLKPYKKGKNGTVKLDVDSVSIMGKAGILKGNKGDIMIPQAHIFEGTTDNYPFENELTLADFEKEEIEASDGHMITVLGTSLQNKEMLTYFKKSTWNVVGLEMEGAHYQKAIQAASLIRKSVSPDLKVRYAYYASDNPLETGSTLASGGLGLTGVKPTYLITEKFLNQIIQKK
ncbi:DUF6909 family protein [Brumimicrobium aurantiacum]|uniref:Uncharacterized protein n=1 Tax=Brumimicrobium aurantiacum TaxID=1737063 RepID=A0A3E1EVQ7_9FLAO|nr:hypothetical protein [Brumimicrobium aurantiacum]RFC53573.1 hypothetical protein DXU93_12470 [Brumimicrobium aurantiacum]